MSSSNTYLGNFSSQYYDVNETSYSFGRLLRERLQKANPHIQNVTLPLEQNLQTQQIHTQMPQRVSDGKKMDDLIKKSNRCIMSISSLWSLFPTTIVIEESRVTFIFRQFLASQSHSIDIKDISNVFIESSLFSATLQIVSRTYIQNDIKIVNLKKKEAERARRIIEGLRTFDHHNIDTSEYEVAELTSVLEGLHVAGEINH